MSEFKVGDKVKCVDSGGDRGCIMGLVGVIMSTHPDDAILWKGFTLGHSYEGNCGWYVNRKFLTKAVVFKGNK